MFVTDIENGLSSEQVSEREKRGEKNGEFEVKTKSVRSIVAGNIFTLFNLINVLLAAAVALVGSYRNMLFMGVVICNVAIGIIQEIRSKRTIDRLSLISAPKARVIRGGKEIEIPTAEIVKDDLMVLSAGNQICADAVAVEGFCEADESLLTGESDPVVKEVGSELFSGSFVISGRVKAQVTRVGAEAYANTITGSAKRIRRTDSVMMRSINNIIKAVSVCIVPFAVVLFLKAIYVTHQTLEEAVVGTTAALIGMIPEGLILLTSAALAVSIIRLARRRMLCQDLYCAESLARVDVLCLDKTGTITEGSMEVREVIPLEQGFDAESALNALAASLTDSNPTINAVKARYNAGSELQCTEVYPFSSAKKWSAAQFEGFAYVFGAPSFVLPAERFAPLAERVRGYSEQGFRVLVLAQCGSIENGVLPEDITAKALVVLSDKIRESAPATLAYFREQGVALKVISGDDPVTVSNVALRAGLQGAEKYADASRFTDEELAAHCEEYTVFGRAKPQQKLVLVKALQAHGHKVAMTGDGVNDVQALREADCSVAMQAGSDAARCVSQIVLLDSDFSAMPLAVEEGRRVINNIQRSGSLFLVKTIFSFVLAAIFLVIPAVYPFKPVQMTLISALTIGAPSFLLALEPNHNLVRGEFIRNVLRRALPGGLSVVLGVVLLLIAQAVFGIPNEQLSVMAMLVTAISGFGVLFVVCRPFNRLRAVMFAVLAIAFVGALLLFGRVFYIVPLAPTQWGILAAVTAVVLLALSGMNVLTEKFSRGEK